MLGIDGCPVVISGALHTLRSSIVPEATICGRTYSPKEASKHIYLQMFDHM